MNISPLAEISNLQRAALLASQAYGFAHPVTAHIRAQLARCLAARDPFRRATFSAPAAPAKK